MVSANFIRSELVNGGDMYIYANCMHLDNLLPLGLPRSLYVYITSLGLQWIFDLICRYGKYIS